MNKILSYFIMIILTLSSLCGNIEKTSTQRTPNTMIVDKSIIPYNTTEPFVGRINLDNETEKFFFGTWKVKKLLGFANSYNDASEYPTGQKIISDKIIIKKDFFSSKGLKNYNVYQYELKNPLYNIIAICYNSDSFYRLFKIDVPDLNINDNIKHIEIVDSAKKEGIPVSFFIVNKNKIILLLEGTLFELEKMKDK